MTGDFIMSDDQLKAGIGFYEEFVKTVGSRYGFWARDYYLIWDGPTFQASRLSMRKIDEVLRLRFGIRT